MSPLTNRLFLALCAVAVLPPTSASADDAACLDAVSKGQRFRDAHKLVEARAQFRVCAAAECPTVVQTDCASWLASVERALPSVVVLATEEEGGSVIDVNVTVDGQPFATKLDGQAIPINPGSHTFHFEVPGGMAADQVVVVPEGEQNHRVTAVMKKPAAIPAPSAAPVLPPTPPAPAPPTRHSGGGMGTQKVLALVVGGVGVVGLGVGAAFGLAAMNQRDAAHTACPDPICPTSDGPGKWRTAGSTGDASTAGFVAGGVAVAAAAVLWFTAPRTSAPSAQVGIGPGYVELKGTW
jgi:hypothetical protein